MYGEITGKEDNTGNYATAIARAAQKLKVEGEGNNRLNLIVFMAWNGCGTSEI